MPTALIVATLVASRSSERLFIFIIKRSPGILFQRGFEFLLPNVNYHPINRRRETPYPKEGRSEAGS
jgi:hypothetical protein